MSMGESKAAYQPSKEEMEDAESRMTEIEAERSEAREEAVEHLRMPEFLDKILEDHFYNQYADRFEELESFDRGNNRSRPKILFSELSAGSTAHKAVKYLQGLSQYEFLNVPDAKIDLVISFYQDGKKSNGWNYDLISYLVMGSKRLKIREL